MKRVPQRALVPSRRMFVPVLSKPEADSLVVPNWVEQADEVIFRCVLPSAPDDQELALEVIDA